MRCLINLRKRKLALVLLLLLQGFAGGDLFPQSQLDSLEVYDPFNATDQIRRIINDNFSVLNPANKILLQQDQEFISEAEKKNRESLISEKLIEIGDIYFKSGIYTSTLQSYFKALNNYEKSGDSINAALIKLKLARVYYFSDLVPAQDFYADAYKVLKTTDNKNISALANYVGGLISKDSKKKTEFFRKALSLQREIIKEFPDDIKAKETLAIILNANNQIEEAIATAEKSGNNWLLIVYLNNFGFEKVLAKNYDGALEIFQRSLNLCKIERNKTLLRNTYENIGRIYRLKGNWQKAAEYQQLMHLVEESLYSERFSIHVSEYKVKYDFEKKEFENALLAEKVAGQTKLNVLLILSITSISVVLLLVLLNRKKLKRANTLLDKQNIEIRTKQNELEVLNENLHESEKNLKEAQATAHLANWAIDLRNHEISFSDQFLKIFQSSVDEVRNNFSAILDELIHKDDKNSVLNFFTGSSSENTEKETEFRIVKDDSTKWIKGKKVLIIDDNGEQVRFFGTVQDITDQKEKEKIKIEIAAQQSFTKQLIQSQEEDRRRIAGELHDSLGQDILLIKNRVLLSLQNAKMDDISMVQLSEINESVTSVLNSLREISFNLRPAHLERLGLTETISSAIKKFEEVSAIKISCKIDNIDGLLTNENEINLFRIIQEGINNILKHSNAKTALIEIKNNIDHITVMMEDDGRGFDYDSTRLNSAGFGLRNIFNRIQILGGSLKIKSKFLEGTRLEITIPLENNE